MRPASGFTRSRRIILNDSSSLKLIAGQSYRVPSLFELYFQTPTNTVYGNTALKPETNDTVELAYSTSFGGLFVEAIAYHARYDNKIYRERRYPIFVSNPNDTSTIYINGEPFSADGLELEARYRLPKNLSAFANYAYVGGDRGDEVPGSHHYNFKYVPRHTAAVGITKYFGNAWVAGIANYRSRADAPLEPIEAQTTYDLTIGLGQRLGGLVLRHLLSAKNIGNTNVRLPEYVRRVLNDVPSG